MTPTKYIIRRALLYLVFTCISALSFRAMAQGGEVAPGQFPFFKSFLDNDLTYIVFPSPNSPTSYTVPFIPDNQPQITVDRSNKAILTNYGLRLTEGISEVGTFYLPQHIFNTDYGLSIEFEYIMMGNDSGEERTDGICMYLVDATDGSYIESNMLFGASGAGFGYTYNWSLSSVNRICGIKGAYLAVALDQGNFKNVRFEGGELRNGIAYTALGDEPSRTIDDTKDTNHDTRSNITIRGSAGQGSKTIVVEGTNINGQSYSQSYPMNEGFWGYPVLATRHTGWSPAGGAQNEALRNEVGYILNTTSGLFEQRITPNIPQAFNIAGNKVFVNAEEPEYRKAIITLQPNPDTNQGGFKVSVTIQHGNEKTVVIDGFTYPKTVTYLENGLPLYVTASNYPQPDIHPTSVTYEVETPENLVIGFSASTGFKTPYTNIIKNLRITPLYAAQSQDDNYEHRRGPATVRPLDNDFAYKDAAGSPATPPIGDEDNLDPASFRFWKDENNLADVTTENTYYTHSVDDVGKWIYDPSTQEVMFFPEKGFTGEAHVFYDIIGLFNPYSQNMYRSSLAKISINIQDSQPGS